MQDTTPFEEILQGKRERAMKIYVVKKEGANVNDPQQTLGSSLKEWM